MAISIMGSGCRRETAPAPVSHVGPVVRVACLAPNLMEIVAAVGAADCLVGRCSACNFPPDTVGKVPVVGDFGKPSVELLAAAKPDVVLEVDLEDDSFRDKMQTLGIRVEHIECKKLDDIPDACMKIGGFTGRPVEARELAGRLRLGIAELRSRMKPENERPLVYAEIWHDPLTTAGRASFVSELIALAGGRNAGDEFEQDYFTASPEWVVSANPDIILDLRMRSDEQDLRQQFLQRRGWQNVKAVSSNRIYGNLNTDVIFRPGPRVLEGIEELRKCIERNGASL